MYFQVQSNSILLGNRVNLGTFLNVLIGDVCVQAIFLFCSHACMMRHSQVRRAFNRKKKVWSESHDLFQTHSLSPKNYNDLSKDTLSTGNGSGVNTNNDSCGINFPFKTLFTSLPVLTTTHLLKAFKSSMPPPPPPP